MSDSIPERDASPDEAYELGEAHGYTQGYRDGRKELMDEIWSNSAPAEGAEMSEAEQMQMLVAGAMFAALYQFSDVLTPPVQIIPDVLHGQVQPATDVILASGVRLRVRVDIVKETD